MSAISEVLWPGLKALAPKSELGGILARKPGYHNSRDHLPTTDYSVGQFAIDREGPASEGSAIDWTFPDAQAGNYSTIARFSRRLLDAGRSGDPRCYPMREFFGNADSDQEVEGWDFAKKRTSTSDTSHLWHIHISIHRKYINDPAAMRSILAILEGDEMSEKAENEIHQVYAGMFYGGTSMGRKVDPDGTGPAPAANSLVAKVDYALTRLDQLAARPATAPAALTDADRDAIADKVVTLLATRFELGFRAAS